MKVDIVRRTPVYQGVVLNVEKRELLLDGKKPYSLDLVQNPGASAVVALDAEGQVLLVRQRRHAVEQELLEVPAGLRDGNEDPLLCAQRELEEEAGVVASNWLALGDVFTSPGCFTERIYLYAARELRATAQALDDDEQIEVVRMPFAEAVARALSGELQDAKTVVALLRAKAAFGRT